jgi:hypothetical protein
MPDFRVAETAPEHPKLRAAGLPAFGLWAAAGAYAMRELTDGWVPEYWITTWPSGKRQAAALVKVGLWSREERTGIPGYRFHDWTDYQRPAAKIHEERAKGRERAQRSRARNGERHGEAADGRAPQHDPDVRVQSHDSRALTRALTHGGSVGEGSSGSERGRDRNARPRCPQHAELPPDAPVPACGACKRLRLAAEADAAQDAEQADLDRALRRSLIDACPACDEQGMRETSLGVARCTHPELEPAT